ncbi:MAG: phosphoribosylaminoimidazolesuccinocarboxamide synthase [Pseudomonadota bacterium]|nr:phosphoribosylaminoimidazolesuccinocarboxamide synthase [Pseudomonadota bacterium]
MQTNTDFEDICLTDTQFSELPNFEKGKVRDSYSLPDGRRVMIATDRQSAFDQVLASVPYKGQVLNETARFWFDKTTDICANHVISYPDPNVIIAKNLSMLPVEMVVRDYITGSTETSIWQMYERGDRTLYGIEFPDGLVKNQKLSNTILTPTTKGLEGAHDLPITPEEVVSQGLLSQNQWSELAQISLNLFARGREISAKNGLILVDTKYEFGVDEEGLITLADEIHTPDSSRYWLTSSYKQRHSSGEEPESLDKEFLRLWVSKQCDPYKDPIPEIPVATLLEFSKKYIALFEQVTGEPFGKPKNTDPVRERIRKNLAGALPDFF